MESTQETNKDLSPDVNTDGENVSVDDVSNKEETAEENATNEEQASEEDAKPDSKEETQDVVDIQLPEGTIIEDKDAFMSKVAEASKSQEGFDELIKTVKELGAKELANAKAADEKAFEEAETKWEDELKKDQDFGKDFSANTEKAAKAIDDLGLTDFAKTFGLNKHPQFVKAMLKVSVDQSDAEVVLGSNAKSETARKDAYGNTMFE